MKKVNSIFIDLRNEEQVKWWNEIGSKLVKIARFHTIVETATNKTVGYVFVIKGMLSKRVIKQNLKFLDNPKRMVINVKK